MEPTSFQISSEITHEAFGEVNVRRASDGTYVSLTLLMEPEIEGAQTGIALDGSASMRGAFGQLKKTPPPEVFNDLLQRGLIKKTMNDGKATYLPTQEAIQILKDKGFWGSTENIVEKQAREMTAYLANHLDEDGGTTVIYWACGDGKEIEVLGDLRAEDCPTYKFSGPQKYGQGTYLVPAMRYFVNRFSDAKYGFYVFITDGALDDFEEVKAYTTQLAQEIAANKRNMVKCVLIGVGDEINREQMAALDDLETGTDVDIWDHKIAKEMRGIMDIFAEVVDENMIVAPQGTIYDHLDNVAAEYPNGLPAALEFKLPPNATHFTLHVGDVKVKQELPWQ